MYEQYQFLDWVFLDSMRHENVQLRGVGRDSLGDITFNLPIIPGVCAFQTKWNERLHDFQFRTTQTSSGSLQHVNLTCI